jgi:hypothetical protein
MNEVKFVDKPLEVLDAYAGKLLEMAEEVRSMGGVMVCAIAFRDEMAKQEGHRFIYDPSGVSAYGLSMLLTNDCFEGMYDQLSDEDDG